MNSNTAKPNRTMPPVSTEATETGHLSRQVSTERVQMLEAPELTLEKTAIVKQPELPDPNSNASPCGGFNPYDRGVPNTARPAAKKAAVARPPSRPVVATPRRPVTVLERLQAWLGRK
jgi:hypothetical protein